MGTFLASAASEARPFPNLVRSSVDATEELMFAFRRRFSLPIGSFVAVLFSVAAIVAGQGTYRAVADADLPNLSLNHYFDAAGKSPGQNFVWTFAADGTFDVQAGEGGVPIELRKRLTGVASEAKQIVGNWKLDAGRISFSEIAVDGKAVPVPSDASYRIYRTAPTVVRIGEPQYVFAVEPKAVPKATP